MYTYYTNLTERENLYSCYLLSDDLNHLHTHTIEITAKKKNENERVVKLSIIVRFSWNYNPRGVFFFLLFSLFPFYLASRFFFLILSFSRTSIYLMSQYQMKYNETTLNSCPPVSALPIMGRVARENFDISCALMHDKRDL